MKHLLIIWFIAVIICGCQRDDSTPQEIWHGGRTLIEMIWRRGGTPLDKVGTPPGFTVTPTMAVSKGRQQRGLSYQVPVLWADSTNYYFTYGFGRKALSRAVIIRGKELPNTH